MRQPTADAPATQQLPASRGVPPPAHPFIFNASINSLFFLTDSQQPIADNFYQVQLPRRSQ